MLRRRYIGGLPDRIPKSPIILNRFCPQDLIQIFVEIPEIERAHDVLWGPSYLVASSLFQSHWVA